MENVIKERNEIEKQYQWDLTTLYQNDEEWEKDLDSLTSLTNDCAAFQGKLNNAQNILAFTEKSNALSRKLSNLFNYASLRKSEDTRAEAAQKMYFKIYGLYVNAISAIAFAEPEILSLQEETLKEITEADCLKEYKFTLENLLRRKAHTLSAKEEQLLASLGEALAVPSNVANTLMDADMVFEDAENKDGIKQEVSEGNFILLQHSSDRVLRKNSFKSFYKGYKQHINTFGASYGGQVKASCAEAKIRNYESSRQMHMANENIPVEVYDNLISAVRKHLPTMYRYVALRKRLLNVDELHYYDLYTPLIEEAGKSYSYDEAKQMVLDAVSVLGEEYCSTVKKGYGERWIDVYPNKGKSGGAYSSGTYDSNPFIMMNFTGTLDSVSTLAHEMGHSMHSWYSNHHQPCHYSDYTLFVAEVASTVNENLMIEQLLKNTDDPQERLSLLNQYLENFKGTVYRQTMFAEFEREAHAMAERGEPLDPTSLNQLYLKLIKDYFGDELTIDEEVSYEWARIPHFYRPFYVYKYATGYSTAVALSEGILNGHSNEVQKYLEFLSMGGSAYPLDELKHAGVDLTTPAPIEAALEKFEKVLEEAEKIADELNK